MYLLDSHFYCRNEYQHFGRARYYLLGRSDFYYRRGRRRHHHHHHHRQEHFSGLVLQYSSSMSPVLSQ